MKKTLLLLLLMPFIVCAQFQTSNLKSSSAEDYSPYFREAYQQYPAIPQGILEAVAYGNTHIYHITHTPDEIGSCTGLPFVYGVMGLTLDGKNYFSNNLVFVSNLSGIATDDIISNPEKNILAYAGAFNNVMTTLSSQQAEELKSGELIFNTLAALSELPHGDAGQIFALHLQLYSYFSFLNNPEFQVKYNFPNPNFDLQTLFGEENYRILSAEKVTVSDEQITDDNGNVYKSTGSNSFVQSTDYPPALWNQAASCNFSSRTQSITAVVIHDIEGSYASCISWFHNCSASVSAHYVVRSSDGQITQMVLESKKAWHVGSENGYTIGIEHEGYQAQTGWYTMAMYQSSANLVKDICNSGYGINPTTCWNGTACSGTCVKPSNFRIKGHQMYPNQTHDDPGPHWDWTTYYNLINGSSGSCGTPSNLTTSSITSTSATLNWTAVPSAISYNITYTSSGGATVSVSATTNSLAIAGLTPATVYQFKVQAVCSQTGNFSPNASFTTPASTSSNTTLAIGTSTTPYSAHPYGTVYMDERVQYIFKKTELTSAGWTSASPYLKSLSFYVSSAAPQAMGNFTITISHVSNTAFSTHSFLTGTNTTVVFSGSVTAVQGWNTYTFTTPYTYNGTSSLLINICWNNSAFTVNSSVHATSYSDFVALYYRADVANGSVFNTPTGTLSYYRPNSRFEFSSTTSTSQSQGQQFRNFQLSSSISDESSFEIYPNPTDGNLLYGKLANTENKTILIKVYDLLGREVLSKDVTVEGGNFSLPIAEERLKTGVYTLVGLTDNNRFIKRVVVK